MKIHETEYTLKIGRCKVPIKVKYIWAFTDPNNEDTVYLSVQDAEAVSSYHRKIYSKEFILQTAKEQQSDIWEGISPG
jgi:2'-5' RNA ligase